MMMKSPLSWLSLAALSLLLGALSPASVALAASNFKASLSVAEGDFEQGEFENALAELQSAIDATDEHRDLARAHLLRARCYAGLGDSEKMKDAFTSVLEHDPLIELDPDALSPTLIAAVENLKETLRVEISIRTNRPGALVLLDGRNIGVAPLRTDVPIGRHEFELRDPSGLLTAKETALIRARQSHELYIPLEERDDNRDDFMSLAESSSSEDEARVDVEADAMRSVSGERAGGRRAYFLIDLRYTLGGAFGSSPDDLKDELKLDKDLRLTGVELGVGVSGRDLLAMVSGTFDGSTWGTTVKFGCNIRLVSILGIQGSLDLPMVFPDGNFYLGAGASVGLNLRPIHLISIFVEGSYRYFFVTPSTDALNDDDSAFFGNNLWGVSVGLRFFI